MCGYGFGFLLVRRPLSLSLARRASSTRGADEPTDDDRHQAIETRVQRALRRSHFISSIHPRSAHGFGRSSQPHPPSSSIIIRVSLVSAEGVSRIRERTEGHHHHQRRGGTRCDIIRRQRAFEETTRHHTPAVHRAAHHIGHHTLQPHLAGRSATPHSNDDDATSISRRQAEDETERERERVRGVRLSGRACVL